MLCIVHKSVSQLESSHDRQSEVITAMRDAAVRLAAGRGGADDVMAIIDGASFLERSVPRHFADEERSVFPRIRAVAAALGDEIDRIVAEHETHLELQKKIAQLVSSWSEPPRPGEVHPLAALCESLARLHAGHLLAETELLRHADGLSQAEDHAAWHEMQDRRGGGGGGGQRQAANGQRPTANGQRPTANGQRPTANDQRPTANDQRPTTNGQRPTENGQRPTANDQRQAADGQREPIAAKRKPAAAKHSKATAKRSTAAAKRSTAAAKRSTAAAKHSKATAKRKPATAKRKPAAAKRR
jgi:hypothetical protein